MNITEFLLARIAEDEKDATPQTNVISGGWPAPEVPNCVGPDGRGCEEFWKMTPPRDAPSGWWKAPEILAIIRAHEMTHITPQQTRILAECAAKRAIIKDTYCTHAEWPTDAELHASASHPAWEYQTTEGQRKRWDDADEPPEGEGWERNTDKGRDGWDRFDYTEESYWRRLKPEAERKEWQQYIPTALRALAAIYADHPDYQEAWAITEGEK